MLLKVWIEARLRMTDRNEGDRGQTAFEYLGIILVVVVIIGAIVGSGIGTAITDRIAAAVAAITAGGG
ncbi:hypothetical protein ABZY31_03450 [Streptomyces sp. NPDC006529]|uniref:hypothetical protein n=1 Tax=Streptomyces sp. NPDC006529 TaxID=3157177 RepID=UPI0033BDBF87